MASLNTLRTKFGFVLSAVIAFALIAFIFSLKSEMGFSNNDPNVGKINGQKIFLSEYQAEYERVKQQSGVQGTDEQEVAQLANAAWQNLISDYVFTPGYEEMGIEMSEAERAAVISGELATQAFASAFMDPRTGVYNVDAISQFLIQSQGNPEAEAMWAMLIEQARVERENTKYLALLRGGSYVNNLEVGYGVDGANNKAAGKWVAKRYSTVADSLYTVSSSEISKYYNDHKSQFRQNPNRMINYVTFDIIPTEEDKVAIENKVMKAAEEFVATDNIFAYTRENLAGSITPTYLSLAQLGDDEAEALNAGRAFGPRLEANTWRASRVYDAITAPDSLGLRHVVLPYTSADVADSLYTALKGGAKIAEVAAQYSVYDQTAANGGEVGVIPFASFDETFAKALAGAKVGDIVKVETSDMIQLIEVYKTTKKSKHIRVAAIEYPVEASAITTSNIFGEASAFAVEAKGSASKFAEAAQANALTMNPAVIANGERTIRSLADSREIAAWAYGAKVGEMSEIFKLDDSYIVAVLAEVDNDKYATVADATPAIKNMLIRDKKYADIVKEFNASSIEAQATALGEEVGTFENVSFSSFYVNGLGVEPAVVGAISQAKEGELSAPVKGNTGVFMFVVDSIAKSEDQSAEAERVRAQATLESRVQQAAMGAIQTMSNIDDLRGQYL